MKAPEIGNAMPLPNHEASHAEEAYLMILYDFARAPNPRRVRIFLSEKGVTVPVVQVDLITGEQFSPQFRAINPACQVPALALDDGTVISEVPAICRYFEEAAPGPKLMGQGAKEQAVIAMWDRRMELEGMAATGEAIRNATPVLKGRALVGPHAFDQMPALVERGKARLRNFYGDLDQRLGASPYIAGESFSIADITAFVAVDMAVLAVKLAIPNELTALLGWRDRLSARQSMAA